MIISPFDVEVESSNLDTFLKEEFTEMTFNFGTKSMFKFKGFGYYRVNKKFNKNILIFVQLLKPFH